MNNNKYNNSQRDANFNIFEFKKWFSDQPDTTLQANGLKKSNANVADDQLIGETVSSRLGLKRLETQIQQHNESIDLDKAILLAKAFKSDHGTVLEANDLNIIIQSSKGQFSLPKIYTKLV